MTDDEFLRRVADIARRLGIRIKPLSLPHIANLVRKGRDPSTLTREAIADGVAQLVPTERIHYDLSTAKDLHRGDLLEHANRIIAAATPTTKPQRKKLTAEQQAWKEKFGTQSLLDRWPELNFSDAPAFVPEDEGE